MIRVTVLGTGLATILCGGCDLSEESTDAECASDAPSAWGCTVALQIHEHEHDCTETESGEEPLEFVVSSEDDGLELLAGGIRFASGDTLCAYRRIGEPGDDTVDVLFQPCNMHPDTMEKGTCYYTFVVALGDLDESVSTATIHRRYAYLLDGSGGEPELKSLGTATLP